MIIKKYMTEKEFKECIDRKQFDIEDLKKGYEDEWRHSTGRELFEKIGFRLIGKGFSQDEALEILGICYGAVAGEYGE